MIGIIENAILERLKSSEMFEGMDIEQFPANFEDYNFTSSMGCILVKYNQEDFSEPETLSATVQTDTYSFCIYLGLRSLTLLNEAHPVIQEIKDLLTGYEINGKKLYPTNIKHIGKINYDDHFWALTFKLKLPNSSKYEKNKVFHLWEPANKYHNDVSEMVELPISANQS